ncbi:MAG: C-GCAxxG-C-C family protein [Spirochaetia bacterium]|nr:C-GCAxxG-C-C family protein [Spirochaetia bacterium]MCF7945570.1 C-GCAxxG-C-C family protein [Spirochaetia bacterium]
MGLEKNTSKKQISVLGKKLDLREELTDFLTENIQQEILERQNYSDEGEKKKKQETVYFLDELIQAALEVRKIGKLPYSLSAVIAMLFLQKGSSDNFASEISDYADEVGLPYAVKKYTVLDRQPDLIQLIHEHYQRISAKKFGRYYSAEYVRRISSIYEAAYQAEVKYHGCAQCTLYGLSKSIKPINSSLFKAATALSGGMAQCGDSSCGGYSGGILYMGTFIGRSYEYFYNDKENQYKSFDMAQRLHDKYIETYGSVIGRDIHEKVFGEFFLLRDERQKRAFGESGAHEYVCPCIVGTAARWVADILMDEQLI